MTSASDLANNVSSPAVRYTASSSLPLPLRGIIPPMVTPLRSRDTLDVAGLERLVEHILEGGVHGLFVLGTTGEGPCLNYRLRRELIDRTCHQVNGRVPVLVGISDTAFVESVHMAHVAAETGATAVVLAPPCYFPAGQPELVEYLEHLVPQVPFPLFLYNIPSHTKLGFTRSPDSPSNCAKPSTKHSRPLVGHLNFGQLCGRRILRIPDGYNIS